MLDEIQIQSLVKKRLVAILPPLVLGLLASFCCLGLFALFQNQMLMPFLGLFCIVPFLIGCWVGDRRAKPYSIECPSCDKDLMLSANRILKTRSCSACEKRVVSGGKLRSNRVYARFCRQGSRKYLVYWFWIWPVGGAVILASHFVWPQSFANCPHVIFIFGLIGTTAAGWTLVRTFDRRYVLQTIASAIILFLGFRAFLLT